MSGQPFPESPFDVLLVKRGVVAASKFFSFSARFLSLQSSSTPQRSTSTPELRRGSIRSLPLSPLAPPSGIFGLLLLNILVTGRFCFPCYYGFFERSCEDPTTTRNVLFDSPFFHRPPCPEVDYFMTCSPTLPSGPTLPRCCFFSPYYHSVLSRVISSARLRNFLEAPEDFPPPRPLSPRFFSSSLVQNRPATTDFGFTAWRS